jgi:hypothetical protein
MFFFGIFIFLDIDDCITMRIAILQLFLILNAIMMKCLSCLWENFLFWLCSNYIFCSKDDKCNGYAMVLFEHATRGFDNSSLG